MKHSSAWYVGDTAATMDDYRSITVKIRGFRTDPELVRCEYPDGSIRSRPYEALTSLRWTCPGCARTGILETNFIGNKIACFCGYLGRHPLLPLTAAPGLRDTFYGPPLLDLSAFAPPEYPDDQAA